MNNEQNTVYVGTGTQKNPELIEVVIFVDELAGHVKTSKRGRNYIQLNVWKRKTATEYGETHSIALPKQKGDENI